VLLAVAVPLHRVQVDDQRIAGEYIGVFSQNASHAAIADYMQFAYSHAVEVESFKVGKMRGVFLTLLPEHLPIHLLQDGVLSYVTENGKVHVGQCTKQNDAIWNLERVSEELLYLSSPQGYTYPTQGGEGVTSYIIDTGILLTHVDFATGRASWGGNFVDARNEDCHGHGTHVAGTVGGVIHGVAKKVTLVAVKVLDCNGSGSYAAVIRGVEYVTNNARKPCNANMSLGGGFNQALNDAVAASIAEGIPYAIAAGNSNADAANFSPASTPSAVTVCSTTIEPIPGSENEQQEDVRSSFSNYGAIVDICAPGTLITSAWIGSNTITRTISGTSMAAPHIAGVMSLIQGANPTFSSGQVLAELISHASINLIDLNCVNNACSQTPNRLVYYTC